MTTATLNAPWIAAQDSRAALTEISLAAAPVQVYPVVSRRDVSEFVELPKRIHSLSQQWVAPLDREVKRFLDPRRHPFYLHGDARAFLAKREGKTVGRVLVSDDPRFNQLHGTNAGCFGMFEVVDDQRTCRALLDRAAGWLRARGRTEVMGPIDFSTNYPCGLLVEGFDTPPAVMMNHQPRYYQRLIERYGFCKAKDLYAWWFGRENNMDSAWVERVERMVARYRIRVRPLDFKCFDAEMARCKEIYHKSFEKNWGFVKMTDAEFDAMTRDLKRLAVPELVQLAEVDGQPVGVSMTLPNLNEAISSLDGRLTTAGLPLGLIRLAYRMRKIRTGRLAVLGVLPGFRRRGVAEALIQQTFHSAMGKLQYHGAELGWTLEDNAMVNRMIERVGGRNYKTYRIYSKSLA